MIQLNLQLLNNSLVLLYLGKQWSLVLTLFIFDTCLLKLFLKIIDFCFKGISFFIQLLLQVLVLYFHIVILKASLCVWSLFHLPIFRRLLPFSNLRFFKIAWKGSILYSWILICKLRVWILNQGKRVCKCSVFKLNTWADFFWIDCSVVLSDNVKILLLILILSKCVYLAISFFRFWLNLIYL